ncbi:MAG: HAD family phosphatase [Planctomycetota bacterium]
MIDTLLFDLGNVLVYFSHERMFAQMAELCGRSPAEVVTLCRQSGINDRFERGEISEAEYHREFEALVRSNVDPEKLYQAASDIFWSNDSIRPIVAKAKQRGLRLVLLSNTTSAHFRFIQERFDVLEPFDEWIVSYEVGAMKPDAPMYEAALERIQCPPQRCLYLDDLEANIQAGRDFGLQAEVYTDTPTLLNHLKERGLELDA